jgi:hypothetical protein
MITTIPSRVAIQARIAEWQRQHRIRDFGSVPSFFREPVPQTERVWRLRAA